MWLPALPAVSRETAEMREPPRCSVRVVRVGGMADVAGIGSHGRREGAAEKYRHVDAARTHLNEFGVGDGLSGADPRDPVRCVAAFFEAHKDIRARKGAAIAAEVICTVSGSYFRPDQPDAFGVFDRGRVDAFRDTAVKALNDRFHVVCWRLDLDEATPHLSALIVPISERVTKTGKAKTEVSFRAEFGGSKSESADKLRRLQDWYAACLQPLGIQRGRSRRETQATYRSPEEMRRQLEQDRQAAAVERTQLEALRKTGEAEVRAQQEAARTAAAERQAAERERQAAATARDQAEALRRAATEEIRAQQEMAERDRAEATAARAQAAEAARQAEEERYEAAATRSRAKEAERVAEKARQSALEAAGQAETERRQAAADGAQAAVLQAEAEKARQEAQADRRQAAAELTGVHERIAVVVEHVRDRAVRDAAEALAPVAAVMEAFRAAWPGWLERARKLPLEWRETLLTVLGPVARDIATAGRNLKEAGIPPEAGQAGAPALEQALRRRMAMSGRAAER